MSTEPKHRAPGPFLKWAFLLMLCTPLAVVLVQRDKNFPRPANLGELMLLPAELKYYFAAKFEMRNRLANVHSQIIGSVDGFDRSSDLVKVGKDGWLFFFMAKRNMAAFGQQDPSLNQKATEKMQRKTRFCEELGVIYLPLIIPTKTSVYPEFLPDRMARQIGQLHGGDVTDLHRFLQTKGTGIRSVDLLTPFLQRKTNAPIYFRTDAHWTEYGAYIAAEETLRELSRTFPDLPLPYEPSPSFSYSETEPGNEGRMLGLQKEWKEQYVHLHLPPDTMPRQANGEPVAIHAINITGFTSKTFITRCETASLPKVMVFQNSFGVALIPYLGRHFREARFEWRAFSEERIRQEKPTVVIELFNTM